jgi:transposase-like protein
LKWPSRREAIAKTFIGATWQRCQVHLMRNLIGHAPARQRTAVIADEKKRVVELAALQRRDRPR